MNTALLYRQAIAAGVTLRLVDGKVKVRGTARALAELVPQLRLHKAELIEALRREAANEPEPPAWPGAWRELAAEYHSHHFACPTCQAAGRGTQYGFRCGVGASLWNIYQSNHD